MTADKKHKRSCRVLRPRFPTSLRHIICCSVVIWLAPGGWRVAGGLACAQSTSAPRSDVPGKDTKRGDLAVYYRINFDDGLEGWTAANEARLALSDDGVVGTIPPRGWSPDSAPEAKFNKNIVELCHRLKTPVGYIFEDFQGAGDRRRYMGSDGVHWRGAGMEIGARAWGKTLEQIRFVLRDRD